MIMGPSDHSRFQQAHDFGATVATALWHRPFSINAARISPAAAGSYGENGGVKQHKGKEKRRA